MESLCHSFANLGCSHCCSYLSNEPQNQNVVGCRKLFSALIVQEVIKSNASLFISATGATINLVCILIVNQVWKKILHRMFQSCSFWIVPSCSLVCVPWHSKWRHVLKGATIVPYRLIKYSLFYKWHIYTFY